MSSGRASGINRRRFALAAAALAGSLILSAAPVSA